MVTCGKCVRQFLDPLDALIQPLGHGFEVDVAPVNRLVIDLHQDVPQSLQNLD
jgi:hypothetical protein